MKLATELCGIELEHPLMNAAGTCKTIEQVKKFARSAVSAVVIGSITVEERAGNPGTTYVNGLNALGLPNPGRPYYRKYLPEMCSILRDVGKVPIVSVAGFSPEEYAELTELAYESGARMVELNLGCPNVWGDDGQKPIPSFYPEAIWDIIEAVARNSASKHLDHPEKMTGAKLSPISNPQQLKEVGEALGKIGDLGDVLGFVTASNTFPNGWQPDSKGNSVISVEYGGVSGFALKPIALGQVRQLRKLLPDTVELIGAGGITTAKDILDYRHAGATAVQAATVYWNADENPGVFGDILADADEDFEV